MSSPVMISSAAFVGAFALVALVGSFTNLFVSNEDRRAVMRLRRLSAAGSVATETEVNPGRFRSLLPFLGGLVSSSSKNRMADLGTRLRFAGIVHPSAVSIFAGARILLMASLTLFAFVPLWLGYVPARFGPLSIVSACAVGMFAPKFWLDQQVTTRQRTLRGALPDALDMLVLCLDGGVSLVSAVQRVADELAYVHPVLGLEFDTVQRDIQIGLSPADALKKFAERCGLGEVRDLAAVLVQSERFGASASRALKTYTEAARQERQIRAEEQAQKAAVKILFPTLLFIFPAIFIVLLGPAAFQLSQLFAR